MRPPGATLGVALVALAMACGACSRAPTLNVIIAGGNGPPTLVLLHGYSSSAEQWAPFTKTIQWPAHGRFVFPQGPEITVPPDGPAGGRAWWPLELGSHVPPGPSISDLSHTRPLGLRTAADLVVDLLTQIDRSPGGPVVLGGFSQGAMVASEVAFQRDTPLTALIILSGTVVDEESWRAHYASRKGLPVFMSHGRSDGVLPFAVADRMREDLEAAGMAVTWHPFDGGHEIPGEVVEALNAFLARVVTP